MITTIDGMIEEIDQTIEQYKTYTNFEPIPLLGEDLTIVEAPAPIANAPMLPTIEQLHLHPMAFNSWCFNILLNQGARFGYPDASVRDQASFAMADAIRRYRLLAEAEGMDCPSSEHLAQIGA